MQANIPGGAYGIGAADWDGDGRIDLALTSIKTNSSGVALIRGNGDGTFTSPVWLIKANGPYTPTFARLDSNRTLWMMVPESLQDRALLYTLDVNLPRVEWYIGDGQSELQQTPSFPPNWSVVDPSAILVNPSAQTASFPVDQTGIFRLRYQ
jgi:hypothetical protein